MSGWICSIGSPDARQRRLSDQPQAGDQGAETVRPGPAPGRATLRPRPAVPVPRGAPSPPGPAGEASICRCPARPRAGSPTRAVSPPPSTRSNSGHPGRDRGTAESTAISVRATGSRSGARRAASWLGGPLHLLHQGVPGPARRAAPGPAWRRGAALRCSGARFADEPRRPPYDEGVTPPPHWRGAPRRHGGRAASGGARPRGRDTAKRRHAPATTRRHDVDADPAPETWRGRLGDEQPSPALAAGAGERGLACGGAGVPTSRRPAPAPRMTTTPAVTLAPTMRPVFQVRVRAASCSRCPSRGVQRTAAVRQSRPVAVDQRGPAAWRRRRR